MTTTKTCPVCSVRLIEDGAKVIFSCGPAGTKARLWARVCQFAKNPDCINTHDPNVDPVKTEDYYQ